MADITITAADVRIVTSIEQWNGPASEAFDAGEYVRPNPTTGLTEPGNATTVAEVGNRAGIAIKTASQANDAITVLKHGLLEVGDAVDSMNYDDPVYLSATDGQLADADPGVNEVQTITMTGVPTGGTFTLTFDGETTAALAFDIALPVLQIALSLLLALQGNIVVGGAVDAWTVTFVNGLANTNVPLMTANSASLTGGSTPTATPTQTTAGVNSVVVGRVVPTFGTTIGVAPDKLIDVQL